MPQIDTPILMMNFNRAITKRTVEFCIEMLISSKLDSRQTLSHQKALLFQASRLGIETSYYYE